MFLEPRPVLADPLRQELLYQFLEAGVPGTERGEVAQSIEAAPNLARIFVLLGKRPHHLLEVRDERQLLLLRPGLRAVEERLGQHNLEKSFLVNLVGRAGDHAQRGDHVTNDRILGQRPLVRETTGDSRGQKAALGDVSDLVLPVQQSELSPRQLMLITIAPNVLDDPRDFGVLGRESQRRYVERRFVARLSVPSVVKNRSVAGDEPPRELDDLTRTAPVLAELRLGADGEVVREVAKHARVSAGP